VIFHFRLVKLPPSNWRGHWLCWGATN